MIESLADGYTESMCTSSGVWIYHLVDTLTNKENKQQKPHLDFHNLTFVHLSKIILTSFSKWDIVSV